jgi:uncharacterized protein
VKVLQLFRYPVKGLRGESVESFLVEPRGPANDRRFMIVDENSVFISQRQFPQLATLNASQNEMEITISSATATCRAVPASTRCMSTIWKDTLETADCGNQMSDFLSDFLKKKIRLVWLPDDVRRATDIKYSSTGENSLSDAYPLLVVNLATLDALNGQLKTPIGIERFRGNIVVRASTAFEEEKWNAIETGKTKLKGVKPCGRCPVITVNQLTGDVDAKEISPLTALASLNSIKPFGAVFGMNLTVETPGMISVHDEFNVLSRHEFGL